MVGQLKYGATWLSFPYTITTRGQQLTFSYFIESSTYIYPTTFTCGQAGWSSPVVTNQQALVYVSSDAPSGSNENPPPYPVASNILLQPTCCKEVYTTATVSLDPWVGQGKIYIVFAAVSYAAPMWFGVDDIHVTCIT